MRVVDIKRVVESVPNNAFIIKQIWKTNKKKVIFTFLNILLVYLTKTYYSVVFMRFIFNAADSKLNRSFNDILIFLVFSLIAMFFITLFNSWFDRRFVKISDIQLRYDLNKMVFEKANSVDVSCYENNDYYDNYTKVMSDIFERVKSVLVQSSTAICAMISSIFVIINIFTINKVAASFTLLPLIGSVVFGYFVNRFRYDLKMKNIPYQRIKDYVNRVFYFQDYAKELRISKIKNVMDELYEDSYKSILKNIKKAAPKIYFVSVVQDVFCFPFVFEGIWLYASYCALVKKSVNLSDFVILTTAIVNTTWMLRDFADSFVGLSNNGLYIKNLKEFLNYKTKIDENQEGIVPDRVDSIEFRNVSFRYDENKDYVLKNVSLKFEKGVKTALVGINGAGKTTIIKLIMRLYDPNEGEILLNGRNIKDYNLKEYRKKIGVIFQDFKLFSMSIQENILLKDTYEEEDIAMIKEAMSKVGILDEVEELPKGINTVISKEFTNEGCMFSGGQLQKLAIVRAIVNDNPVLVFDEPSSALDPIAEYNLFECLFDMCEDPKNSEKLTVLISHRLSSIKRVDMIYVIKGGKVIESGNHEELMKSNGEYSFMYRKQAESYLSA